MAPSYGRTGPVPDYYALLGVPPDANIGQIKKAYRKESLLHHPGINLQTYQASCHTVRLMKRLS